MAGWEQMEDTLHQQWDDGIELSEQWIKDYEKRLHDNARDGQEKIMDMTQYAASESNDLKAADFVGKNLKVCIESVEIRHYDARNDQPASDKGVLHFRGKEKTLVLNKTNTKALITAYGKDSEKWIGKEIGLSTHETEMGTGWGVKPLGVKEPEFDEEVPF